MNRRWADPVEGTDPPDGPLRSRARPGPVRPTTEPGPVVRPAVRPRPVAVLRTPSARALSPVPRSVHAPALPGADPRVAAEERPASPRPAEPASGAECCTAERPPSDR